MPERQTMSVLAVCVDQTHKQHLADEGTMTASSARQAIDLLRMLRFDLLITGSQLPDMSLFAFIQRVKTAWPWQKWALLATDLTREQEIAARTLGVTSILDQLPHTQAMSGLARHSTAGAPTMENNSASSLAETRGKAAG